MAKSLDKNVLKGCGPWSKGPSKWIYNIKEAVGNFKKSLADKMIRLDEAYDFCITDNRKRAYALGYAAGEGARVAAPMAVAMAIACNAAGCKLPSGDDSYTPPKPSPTQPGLPTVNLSGVNGDVTERATNYAINLSPPTDPDTPGVVVPYTAAETISGGVTPVTINGNQLIVNGSSTSADAPYKIKLTFGTPEGGINTATLEGTLKNLCGVSGNLRSVVTGAGIPGPMEICDESDNVLGSTSASSDGSFYVEANAPVSNIVLKGKDNQDGFKAKLRFDGTRDHSGASLLATPKFTLSTKTQFRDGYFGQINTGVVPDLGLIRWESNALENLAGGVNGGVELMQYDPLSRGYDFSDGEAMKTKILGSWNIRKFIENRGLSVSVNKTRIPLHASIVDGQIVPDIGWVIVVPDYTHMAGGHVTVGDLNGMNNAVSSRTVYRARIELGSENNYLGPHEWGHVFLGGGHTNMAPFYNGPVPAVNTLSLMVPQNVPSEIGPLDADELAAHICAKYAPKTRLDDMLNLE
jgi:hypothetical protein